MTTNKPTTLSLPLRTSGSSPDLVEAVAWLECQGRPTSVVYREVEQRIQTTPAPQEVLFLILNHLERIEGSLTEFIVVLESILRTSPVQVVLGDPSGYVPLVLTFLDREPQFRMFRPTPGQSDPRPVLIVDSSRHSGEILSRVFASFRRPHTLTHTSLHARKALAHSTYGHVLLDLDFPKMQSFAIAELIKNRHPRTAVVGMTAVDEPWTPENSVRYGLRSILSRPASVLNLLETIF